MIHNMLLYVLSDCVVCTVCGRACSMQCALHYAEAHGTALENERHGIVNSNTYYFSSIYLILNSFCTFLFRCVCAFVVDIAVFCGH